MPGRRRWPDDFFDGDGPEPAAIDTGDHNDAPALGHGRTVGSKDHSSTVMP